MKDWMIDHVHNYGEKFKKSDFLKVYPWATRFARESIYYKIFLRHIDCIFLMDDMKNCNDKEGVPPIYTFMHHTNINNYAHITPYEKRCLGACISFVFRRFLGYECAVNVPIGDLLYPSFVSGSVFLKKKPSLKE